MNSLIKDYVEATKEVYGVTAYVPKKYEERFDDVLQKLYENDIHPYDYALIICLHYEWMLKKKKWKRLPINVFLSSKNIDIVKKKMRQMYSPREDDNQDAVFQAEMAIAEMVFGCEGHITEKQAIEMLDLPIEWYETAGAKNRPKIEVATALKKIAGISCGSNDYITIARIAKENRR